MGSLLPLKQLAANFHFVRDLLIDVLGLAALSVNGWFSRRAAALRMMRTRRFSCCERAQREIAMAVMGDLPPAKSLTVM